MRRSLVVEFTKMNGAGNDFIVVDNRFFGFSDKDLARMAKTFCPRRLGVGADGLLALDNPRTTGTHFRMRYVNADGSIGTMCGNGARCLALFARNAGMDQRDVVFETDAGVHRGRVAPTGDSVRLWFPPPYPAVDLGAEKRLPDGDDPAAVFPVWTGTEHAVCFVPDVAAVDVEKTGARIRQAPAFAPRGVNVDFVQFGRDGDLRSAAEVRARTFEKGVESETLACGTGAVAAALVTAARYSLKAREVDVRMPGGVLTVGTKTEGDTITELYLEGPVQSVYRGSFDFRV